MEVKEIRQQLAQLQAEKDQITTKIDEARRKAHATGVFADPKWLTSAEHARRLRGREIGKLQVALSEALRKGKAEVHSAQQQRVSQFERQFMAQARAILPPALYQQVLMQAAQAIGESS